MMKWICWFLLSFTLISALPAAQSTFADGKIVSVEDKVKTTVLYYQVNTPVTRDDPYYEITVQLRNTEYKGIYTPRHAKDLLPAEWIPGAEVKARLDGRRMILLTPVGNEIEMAIAARTIAGAGQTSSGPAAK